MSSLTWNQITDSLISTPSNPTGVENLTTVEAALQYATLGWKIFPCHGIIDETKCTSGVSIEESSSPGKRPATTTGHKGATFDPETIKRWWHTQPRYNIGVSCKESGFLVVDVGPRSGGDESFSKLLELTGTALPKTVMAITGKYTVDGKDVRGRHFYFRCDKSENLVGNLKNFKLPGIDIKFNGYVIVPPSQHFSGVEYAWVAGHEPWSMPIAEAPEFLLSVIRANTKPAKKGSTKRAKNDFDGFLELPPPTISTYLAL